MLLPNYPFYLANKPVYANQDLAIANKYTNQVETYVAMANVEHIEQAIAAADSAKHAMQALPAYKRQAALQHCVIRFKERFDELAHALCIEAGKPIKDSRGEVTRLIDTFQIAAEESTRIYGEVMPMDISPRSEEFPVKLSGPQNSTGYCSRMPIHLKACEFNTGKCTNSG